MITSELIKNIPQSIGLYFFKRGEEFIYIGKSLNIRERVKNHKERALFDAKEKAIIDNSDSIEHIICSSELHALVLESQYIQKYRPPYNVIWKDDKSYLYIKIPMKDSFPRISLVRREMMVNRFILALIRQREMYDFFFGLFERWYHFVLKSNPLKIPVSIPKLGCAIHARDM